MGYLLRKKRRQTQSRRLIKLPFKWLFRRINNLTRAIITMNPRLIRSLQTRARVISIKLRVVAITLARN
jgi:hypothetical protein